MAPAGQGCCGALALHAGRLDEARAFARRTIEVFERAGVERIAVNAAGCGSSMKEYGQLLADDPAWADRARASRRGFATSPRSSPSSARRGRRGIRSRCASPITTPATSRTRRASGSRRAICCVDPRPRAAAARRQDICCGSAGIYNLVEPDTARELGDRKAGPSTRRNPDVIATANPGCMLQLAPPPGGWAAVADRASDRDARRLDPRPEHHWHLKAAGRSQRRVG